MYPLASYTRPFEDEQWLRENRPLRADRVMEYFARSPFYDRQSNNEELRRRGVMNLQKHDMVEMVGVQFYAEEITAEAHTPTTTATTESSFIVYKVLRSDRDTHTVLGVYYILHGVVYEATSVVPDLSARLQRCREVLNSAQHALDDARGYAAAQEDAADAPRVRGRERERVGGGSYCATTPPVIQTRHSSHLDNNNHTPASNTHMVHRSSSSSTHMACSSTNKGTGGVSMAEPVNGAGLTDDWANAGAWALPIGSAEDLMDTDGAADLSDFMNSSGMDGEGTSSECSSQQGSTSTDSIHTYRHTYTHSSSSTTTTTDITATPTTSHNNNSSSSNNTQQHKQEAWTERLHAFVDAFLLLAGAHGQVGTDKEGLKRLLVTLVGDRVPMFVIIKLADNWSENRDHGFALRKLVAELCEYGASRAVKSLDCATTFQEHVQQIFRRLSAPRAQLKCVAQRVINVRRTELDSFVASLAKLHRIRGEAERWDEIARLEAAYHKAVAHQLSLHHAPQDLPWLESSSQQRPALCRDMAVHLMREMLQLKTLKFPDIPNLQTPPLVLTSSSLSSAANTTCSSSPSTSPWFTSPGPEIPEDDSDLAADLCRWVGPDVGEEDPSSSVDGRPCSRNTNDDFSMMLVDDNTTHTAMMFRV